MPTEPFPDIEPLVLDRVRLELAGEPDALACFAQHVAAGGVATMIEDCVETLMADPTATLTETLARGGGEADVLVGSVVGYVTDAFVDRCRLGRT